jgi:orotidine-5'-phosphate decarboxylase
MNFINKLNLISLKNNSLLCIGLDSDFDKLPESVKNSRFPQFEFNKAIIDVTYDLVSCYKPNSAFYEARGADGINDLKMTCDYLQEKYPDIPVILDAKRADIGSTNEGYVKFAFDYLGVDAITVHPYLGHETLKPFLDRKDKGIIILCRTSNPGAFEFQDLVVNNNPLYQMLARKVIKDWNYNNNCLLVVGATYPKELKIVRDIVGEITLLIPGVGAQGGDLDAVMKNGLTKDKKGLIINSSRGIIFAGCGNDFAEIARDEALKLKNNINAFR